MNPKKFLTWTGWILLLLSIIGFAGISFGDWLNFDSVENWAHTLLGIVALAIAYGVKDQMTVKWVTIIFGAVALLVGVWGFLVASNPTPNFYGITNLENPLDNLVHLVVGIWGLWAAFGSKS